ncbi:hypothetical protein PIB30_091692 [Stylosanthes scabra]|uniref:Secreted protein n=1 Tax=Stylosanthes scabra TaxID=79078 RepID=A0ABU6XTQ6_9FABA|nr:hypothetical protein [Stylosanthes scabra]
MKQFAWVLCCTRLLNYHFQSTKTTSILVHLPSSNGGARIEATNSLELPPIKATSTTTPHHGAQTWADATMRSNKAIADVQEFSFFTGCCITKRLALNQSNTVM